MIKENIIKILIVSFVVLFNNKIEAQQYINDTTFKKTESGLKYKIIKAGQGEYPKSGDRIWVHYYAKFDNDSIYDSTAKKGPVDAYLGRGQLIKGWEEGLRLIKPKGSIILIVPPELAYGDKKHGKIPANSTLIFEIALLQVDKGKQIEPFSIKDKKIKKGKKNIKYYVVEEGDGDYANFGDNVYINFTGYLPDGTIFDSSYKKKKPIKVTVGREQVIKGLDIGLLMMNKGSKMRLIIPSELAYGEEGLDNIVPPNTDVTIDVEMVDLTPYNPVSKWKINKDTVTTSTGLKYIIETEGEGEFIKDDDIVEVYYSGYFIDGELFDSSVEREETLKFPVGANAVIDGWDEGVRYVKKGGKIQLIIPSDLAYGEEGMPSVIPPNTDLIFDIEVINVIK
jgi:FKBP-type peptidyl-prolyl cis-trans isomerase